MLGQMQLLALCVSITGEKCLESLVTRLVSTGTGYGTKPSRSDKAGENVVIEQSGFYN